VKINNVVALDDYRVFDEQREMWSKHKNDHPAEYHGIYVTADNSGKFLISTFGNLDHGGAIVLLEQVMEAVAIDNFKTPEKI